MNLSDLKLKELSSRKFYPITNDRITFAARVKANHLFNYVDEAVYYIDRIIEFPKIEKDVDMIGGLSFDIDNDMTKTLIINTIEESIVTIISEIIQQMFRDDIEFIQYIRMLVQRSQDKIKYNYDINVKENNKIWFYEELYIILDKILYLCAPQESKEKIEEIFEYDLAKSYYNLMIRLNSKIDNQYNRDLIEYYQSLMYQTDINE